MKGPLFLVPNGIRPVMQRTAIEVWGLVNVVRLVVQIYDKVCSVPWERSGQFNNEVQVESHEYSVNRLDYHHYGNHNLQVTISF